MLAMLVVLDGFQFFHGVVYRLCHELLEWLFVAKRFAYRHILTQREGGLLFELSNG